MIQKYTMNKSTINFFERDTIMMLNIYKKIRQWSVLVFLWVFLCSSCGNALHINDLIKENGEVSDTMIEILAYTGVRIENHPADINWPPAKYFINSAHINTVIELIQGRIFENYNWFRDPLGKGSENQKIFLKTFVESASINVLMALLTTNMQVNQVKGFNMTSETLPNIKDPTHVLLLGTTISDFRDRLNYFVFLLKSRIIKTMPQIYILTGKRHLYPEEIHFLRNEKNAKANEVLLANNETQAMVWVYEKIQKTHPVLKSPIIIADEMPTGARATTLSTVTKFFKSISSNEVDGEQNQISSLTKKKPKILLISTHIYALYQLLITKRAANSLHFNGIIDVAAKAYNENDSFTSKTLKLGSLLNYLSRIYYELWRAKNKC